MLIQVIGMIIGSLFVGLIFHALSLFQKPEKRLDAHQIYSLTLVPMLLGSIHLFSQNRDSPPVELNRLAIAEDIKKECLSLPERRLSFINSDLGINRMEEYCSCLSARLGNNVTQDELAYLDTHKSFPDSLIAKAKSAIQPCVQSLAQSRSGI